MELNYQEIAERAVASAKQINIVLDYTEQSIDKVEEILDSYHENLVQHCLNNDEKQCLIFVSGQGGGRRQCGGIVD